MNKFLVLIFGVVFFYASTSLAAGRCENKFSSPISKKVVGATNRTLFPEGFDRGGEYGVLQKMALNLGMEPSNLFTSLGLVSSNRRYLNAGDYNLAGLGLALDLFDRNMMYKMYQHWGPHAQDDIMLGDKWSLSSSRVQRLKKYILSVEEDRDGSDFKNIRRMNFNNEDNFKFVRASANSEKTHILILSHFVAVYRGAPPRAENVESKRYFGSPNALVKLNIDDLFSRINERLKAVPRAGLTDAEKAAIVESLMFANNSLNDGAVGVMLPEYIYRELLSFIGSRMRID